MAKKKVLTGEDLVGMTGEEVAELVLSLQTEADTANEALKTASKRIAILEKENATLKSTVAAPEAAPQKPTLPAESFSCTPKGEDQAQEYVFALAKFRYKGQDITAVDALTDTQLLQELVDCGSGVIKVKN